MKCFGKEWLKMLTSPEYDWDVMDHLVRSNPVNFQGVSFHSPKKIMDRFLCCFSKCGWMSCQWKNFCQWLPSSDCLVLKHDFFVEAGSWSGRSPGDETWGFVHVRQLLPLTYTPSPIILNFHLLIFMTYYGLIPHWNVFKVWNCIYVYHISKAIFMFKQYVLFPMLAPKFFSGKNKRLLYVKQAKLGETFWDSLLHNLTLETSEQNPVFYTGWIGNLEGLTSFL